MHTETLLYMLLQRAGSGTIPPPGFSPPDWPSLTETWNATPEPATATVTLGPAVVSIGHDDSEVDDAYASDAAAHEYGWDNEHPKRQVSVGEFSIEWRPVTNGQFHDFYTKRNGEGLQFPSSWVKHDTETMVIDPPFPLILYLRLTRYALFMDQFPCKLHTIGRSSHHTTTCRRTPQSKEDGFLLSQSFGCSTTNLRRGMKEVQTSGLEIGIPCRTF